MGGAVAESPSAIPTLPGLAVETVEWLPSGAESGLVRVRGRWIDEAARRPELPVLALRAVGAEHRFESLPDARFSRDPSSWRGTYLVPAALVTAEPEALWLEWGDGARSGLPTLSRGLEPPPVPGAPADEQPEDAGGQVIDRAVMAERRARRAEASERRQARVAAEALKAVEVLELRSTELERRLEEATAERDALVARESEADERRGALAAALASAAALRSRSREWQLHMRTSEVTRAGDAVRLAVLEAERATTAPALRAALDEANEAAVSARAALTESDGRFTEAREAWDRRRADLEAELAGVRSELAAARAEAEARLEQLESASAAAAGAESRLQVEEVARSALEDELDRERAARAADRAATADLRRELELARADAAEADDLRAELDAIRGDAGAVTGLRAELDAARAEAATGRAALDALRDERDAARNELSSLRADLEAARTESSSLRADLEAARAAADERAGETETLQARIAELEATGRDQLARLAEEQTAAAAAREPTADSSQVVADLDAAAQALRERVAPDADAAVDPIDWPDAAPVQPGAEPVEARDAIAAAESWAAVIPASEPVAPDAEPAVEWAAPRDEPAAPDAEPAVEWDAPVDDTHAEVTPGVEPRRDGEDAPDAEWGPRSAGPSVVVEPPAPDAEPYVEWTPPETPQPPSSADVVSAPAETSPVPDVAPIPAGPKIVPATRHPSRGLATGADRRDYPLLRGAIVKLAHDNPALAGRLLAALLPAQGAAIEGPLAYDLTIAGTGTYGVGIAAGRATVEELAAPRGRPDAEFHLRADPLVLAELLAGVDHRIGRFFGPVRVRGRKRRAKDLKALAGAPVSLSDAARAGAALDPELVYRTFAYAVHPSWTRGHDFTIAQEIEGEPPETWYLTAADGAGLRVSAKAPDAAPAATVSMSRETFGKLLRGELLVPGTRPCVRGDRSVVDQMREWTQRARANA